LIHAYFREAVLWWLTDAEALLAEAQQERRTAVEPLYDEVAEWLSSTKKMETCMREIMQQVAFIDEATSAKSLLTRSESTAIEKGKAAYLEIYG
jgi:hypothetical protein